MNISRLPRTTSPAMGEIFSSWIRRLANINRLSTKQVLQRCGYIFQGTTQRPNGYNLQVPADILTKTSLITYVDTESIEQTLLERYRNSPLTMPDTNTLHSPRLVASHNWVDLRGSNYCPECLAENDGAWQQTWRFPWTYGCLTHHRMLISVCPNCEQTPGGGRRIGILGTPFPTWIPSPTRCPNPAPKPIRRAGRAAQPCDTDLSNVQIGSPITTADIETLNYLNARMNIPQASENLRIWWSDLRALTSALLAVGNEETLHNITGHPLPDNHQDTWTSWVDQRNKPQTTTIRNYQLISPPSSPRQLRYRHTTKVHTWHSPPQDPALIQAILPAALAILGDTTPGALDRAYHHSLRHHTGIHWLPMRLREAGISKELSNRIHDVIIRARSSRQNVQPQLASTTSSKAQTQHSIQMPLPLRT